AALDYNGFIGRHNDSFVCTKGGHLGPPLRMSYLRCPSCLLRKYGAGRAQDPHPSLSRKRARVHIGCPLERKIPSPILMGETFYEPCQVFFENMYFLKIFHAAA